MPLNPGEAPHMQMFIWNNLFFSLGFDVSEHYSPLGGHTAARAAATCDLRGAQVGPHSNTCVSCGACGMHLVFNLTHLMVGWFQTGLCYIQQLYKGTITLNNINFSQTQRHCSSYTFTFKYIDCNVIHSLINTGSQLTGGSLEIVLDCIIVAK